MRSRPHLRSAAAGLALAAILSACSSSATNAPVATNPPAATSGAGATNAPAAGAGDVTIQNFAFSPASMNVKVGDTVTWTNKDSAGHTVTADDGSFDSKTVASGATFKQTFSKAGTFTYHCSIHTSMKATVVVQ